MRYRLIPGVLTGLLTLACLTAATAAPGMATTPGPNGQIVFERFDPAIQDDATYIVNADGSHERRLFPGQSSLPRWSPDGSLVAFDSGAGVGCPPCSSTIIMNPDTGSYRVIAPPDPALATDCAIWSPDARRLACDTGSPDGTADGVYTMRTSDGGGLTRVTNAGGMEDIPIDYSPDGRQIVFGRADREDHHCTTRSALYVVNVDGSGLRRITPWGFCDDDGGWSPDGTTIVFGNDGSLFTVHPDGTGLAKIALKTGNQNTAFNAFDVGWSPDGTRIVFSHSTKSGLEGIYTAKPDGTDVQAVTTSPTRDSKVDWGSHPATR
jgi:TolB protein